MFKIWGVRRYNLVLCVLKSFEINYKPRQSEIIILPTHNFQILFLKNLNWKFLIETEQGFPLPSSRAHRHNIFSNSLWFIKFNKYIFKGQFIFYSYFKLEPCKWINRDNRRWDYSLIISEPLSVHSHRIKNLFDLRIFFDDRCFSSLGCKLIINMLVK
jgi:hypothetical protein